MLSTSSSRLLLALLSSSLFLLTGCSNSTNNTTQSNTAQSDNTTQQSASKSTTNNKAQETANTSPDNNKPNYVVATVKIFKPFVLRDEQLKLTGFDIDTLNAIAKDQNFNITFAVVPRDEIYEGIMEHKYDMAISGISITPERQETMQFSEPYYHSHKAVLAKADKPEITNLKDLSSYNVSVIANGTSAELIEDIIPDKAHIQYVETPYRTIEQVIQDKSDYALGDAPVLSYYAKDLNDLNLKVYKDQQLPAEPYGILFAKDRDDDLVQKVNLGLKNIKADGTYQALEQKWFGQ
ncbi:substrate-binding periplasmic protein [Psychrobacter sp. I-STPA6b]|uniref:substrate-binding periplasmic protein n=1 Tax=Psychrobacter sp. I-STPA6b TaxID=2585718 RepID=UPI001D0C2359|nr:ABC transporter substrate-binding protein [Psychrobacter sp. I-STPA6b]